jgi:hypothetical protein
MEWRRVNEQIELETEGVEPLLRSYAGYTSEVRYAMSTAHNLQQCVAIGQTVIAYFSSYSFCALQALRTVVLNCYCASSTVHILKCFEQSCTYVTDHLTSLLLPLLLLRCVLLQ